MLDIDSECCELCSNLGKDMRKSLYPGGPLDGGCESVWKNRREYLKDLTLAEMSCIYFCPLPEGKRLMKMKYGEVEMLDLESDGENEY